MAAAAGIKEHQAMRALAVVPGVVKAELYKGGSVTLGSLGVFKRHQQAARVYKHPKTGQTVAVPEKTTIKFQVSRVKKEL